MPNRVKTKICVYCLLQSLKPKIFGVNSKSGVNFQVALKGYGEKRFHVKRDLS